MDDKLEIQIHAEADAAERNVHIEGELSLLTAGRLRTILLDSLQPGARTVLHADGVSAVDLSGLQLLCSAHRTYLASGAFLALDGTPATMRDAAAHAGFDARHSVCPYRCGPDCLWR